MTTRWRRWRERRRIEREQYWEQIKGIHVLPKVNASPDELPPSAAIKPPPNPEETVTFSGPDRGAQAVQWLLSDDDD
jgi:hypothetical protein